MARFPQRSGPGVGAAARTPRAYQPRARGTGRRSPPAAARLPRRPDPRQTAPARSRYSRRLRRSASRTRRGVAGGKLDPAARREAASASIRLLNRRQSRVRCNGSTLRPGSRMYTPLAGTIRSPKCPYRESGSTCAASNKRRAMAGDTRPRRLRGFAAKRLRSWDDPLGSECGSPKLMLREPTSGDPSGGFPDLLRRPGAQASSAHAETAPAKAGVFGLAVQLIRNAVARWLRARADGLNADQAARAVGVSRATLYRWAERAEPQSRRPVRVRKPSWTPALARAVEDLRADNPMWGGSGQGPRQAELGGEDSGGNRKLAAVLRREGVAVSTSLSYDGNRVTAAIRRRGLQGCR